MSVKAFYPHISFPDVSITGDRCSLGCLYCKGRYLHAMYPAITPEQLYSTAANLKGRGARGMLISGGSTLRGDTPLAPFLATIERIKRELGLVISVHPGIVDGERARSLRAHGVDIADYELILDPVVIREVKGLRGIGPGDYVRSLYNLLEHGPRHVAVHIPIGFRYGKIRYEHSCVDVAVECEADMIVFLVFTPTPGTPMHTCAPPSPSDVASIIAYARKRFDGLIALGCMRPPQHKRRLDPLLIAGELVDRVTNPPPSMAREHRLEAYGACCSVPEEMLGYFPRVEPPSGLMAKI